MSNIELTNDNRRKKYDLISGIQPCFYIEIQSILNDYNAKVKDSKLRFYLGSGGWEHNENVNQLCETLVKFECTSELSVRLGNNIEFRYAFLNQLSDYIKENSLETPLASSTPRGDSSEFEIDDNKHEKS